MIASLSGRASASGHAGVSSGPEMEAALPRRTKALLFTSGAALMLTQYVAVREIGSTFFSTELTAIAAVAVAMVGPSIAYAVGARLDRRMLAVWGTLSVAAHLALPFGLRALVGV